MDGSKIDSNDEKLVKLESFDEEPQFNDTGNQQQFHQQQTDTQVSRLAKTEAMENMNEYTDMAKSTSKRIRKYKNKQPNIHKVDMKAKLERSRQSARECRARKKLRYQYLEDLVLKRENANITLKKEIEQFKEISTMFANGCSSNEIEKKLNQI